MTGRVPVRLAVGDLPRGEDPVAEARRILEEEVQNTIKSYGLRRRIGETPGLFQDRKSPWDGALWASGPGMNFPR